MLAQEDRDEVDLAGVSPASQRRLLPVGVAAGIAAAFNAPIAAAGASIVFTESLLELRERGWRQQALDGRPRGASRRTIGHAHDPAPQSKPACPVLLDDSVRALYEMFAMYQLDFAAQVDRGLVRESNEDVARVAPQLGLVVVADGMGGHERGDVASAVAADTVHAVFERLGGVDADAEETARRLVSAFQQANRNVRAQPSSHQAVRMGTTLVAAALGNGHAVVAHVGDSRCYLVRTWATECLTDDHSYPAELRRQGLDGTPELRAAAEQYQNVLTRSIGGEDEVVVDAKVLRLQIGDVLVLCSDGLWGGVAPDTIERIVAAATSAEETCSALIGAAWCSGGLDNIGVAVVRVLPMALRADLPPECEATSVASP